MRAESLYSETKQKRYPFYRRGRIFTKSLNKIRWSIISIVTIVTMPVFAAASGQTQSNEPVIPCFLVRPGSIQGYSRPDLTAKLRQLFYPSKLTCSPEIFRDDKGNEFRYVRHNDRSYPGRAYVRASDVHTDVSRGGPGLDEWVATLRQHIAARRMNSAQELLIAAKNIFGWDPELAAINLALATDPLLSHSYSNLTIDIARRELEMLRSRGIYYQPLEPEPERTSPPHPGSTVFAAIAELQLLEEPREEGTVSGFVPIGAKAEVLTIHGPWAKVRLEKPSAGTDIWEVKQEGVRMVISYSPVSEGYAPWNLLSDQPPAVAELLSRASDFEKTSDYLQALRDLTRVAALTTPSNELGKRMHTAGIMAGHYIEAIRLDSIEERIVSGENAHAVVEMQIISRCRGERVNASVIDLEAVFAPFYSDSGAGTRLSSDAFSALPDNACLVPFGECGCEGGTRVRPEHRRIQREFTDGPWLKIAVSVPARPFPRDSQLFIFETPNYFAGCQGQEGNRLINVFPAVPWPEPGGERIIWVKLKSLRGFRGAVEAHDKNEARKRAIDILKKCDPRMQLPDRVNAIGGARTVGYCGC